MYKLKEIPEDFVVIERSNFEFGTEGKYIYFKMKKKNYNTTRALEHIASKLRVPLEWFGFAGNKDKKAVTEQFCSVKGVSVNALKSVELEDISIEIMGLGDIPISLGNLKGNYFEIVIREIDEKPLIKDKFVNYFGPQRFGQNNVEIGRCLIKKDFKEACRIMGKEDVIPVEYLNSISRKISRIYTHAYQSYIWNKTVERIISKGIDVDEVPLIGFGTEFDNEEVKEICKEVMKEEGVKKRDFIIRQLPELSCEGDMRKVYCDVSQLEIYDLEDNDLGSGKKCKVKFFLGKGCYATEFIRQLIEK